MMKSTRVIQKRGRPGGRADHDPATTIRLPRYLSKAIDDWKQANMIRGRPEAIRRLVEAGLEAKVRK